MIRRKYANMRIYEDNIDFADVENTITYSLSAKNLENNLNKREEELCNRIADLEAKLSEKDKEYQSFKKIADENVNYLKNRILEETKNYNQDKISFTIDELEKVKETAECVLDNALKNSSLNQSYYDRLLDGIDEQIKSLKGEE